VDRDKDEAVEPEPVPGADEVGGDPT